MRGFSAADKAAQYALLTAAGYACAYGLLAPFVPAGILEDAVRPMLAACAVVLFLPCFFPRAAKIAGPAAAAGAFVFLLYRIFAGRVIPLLKAADEGPDLLLGGLGIPVAALLCLLAAAVALAAFFCRGNRGALTLFWAAGAAPPVVLSLAGYEPDLTALLALTGCCGVLFARCGARGGTAPEAPRARLRVTAAAAAAVAVLLAGTQLGFTALHTAFGSNQKLDLGQVVLRVRNSFFPSTGFGDYQPDRQLGRSLTLDSSLVLEVQADGPFYLRGRIYDTYAGRSWHAAEPDGLDDSYHRSISLSPPGYVGSATTYDGTSSMAALYMRSFGAGVNYMLESRTISVTTETRGQKYLFLPNTAAGSMAALAAAQIPLRRTYPDFEAARPLEEGTTYIAAYWQPQLTPADFQRETQLQSLAREKGVETEWAATAKEMSGIYGSTAGLTARTVSLAKSITKGCSNEYEKAEAIREWLQDHCRYTLDPPQPANGQDFVDYFLFVSRKGYCEHFATAMTMLLRASGVPARYVEGYASPSVSESGLYEVTNAQAHAWVEYYSPFYGFLTEDPTPASALPETLTQGEAQAKRSASSSSASSAPKTASSSAVSSSQASSSVSSSAPRASSASSGSARGKGVGPGLYYGGAAAGILLVFLLCLYGGKAAYRALWLAVVRRRDDRGFVLPLYGYFAAVLVRLGFAVPPSGTPQNLADRVRGRLPFGAVDFDRVTRLYQRVRFGERGLTRGEREELLAFYRALPAVCRKKLGRLRYRLLYPALR